MKTVADRTLDIANPVGRVSVIDRVPATTVLRVPVSRIALRPVSVAGAIRGTVTVPVAPPATVALAAGNTDATPAPITGIGMGLGGNGYGGKGPHLGGQHGGGPHGGGGQQFPPKPP
jgi:hypothetical protein